MSAAVSPDDPKAAATPAKDGLRRLLTALVKIALVGEAAETAAWRADATAALTALRGAEPVSPSHLDAVWTAAVGAAERDPAVRRGETVNPTLPAMVPLGADLIGAEPFDLDEAVRTIRDAASFG